VFQHRVSYVPPPVNQVLIEDWRDGNGFNDDYLTTNDAVSRLAGFWFCCCQVVYSYGGMAIIGITANEAERQRETLPKAVRIVIRRLILYYVFATFALGVSLWRKDPLLGSSVNGYYSSPYYIMVQRSGVPLLGDLTNGMILVACLSTANANLYETVVCRGR
jgi:amino acid permease